MAHRLTHGRTAQDNRLHNQERRIRRKIRLERPSQGGAVEQNGFLRQPVQARAGAHSQVDRNGGMAVSRPIDFFARLRGQGE